MKLCHFFMNIFFLVHIYPLIQSVVEITDNNSRNTVWRFFTGLTEFPFAGHTQFNYYFIYYAFCYRLILFSIYVRNLIIFNYFVCNFLNIFTSGYFYSSLINLQSPVMWCYSEYIDISC
jgi:hypothetical protein